MLRAGVAVPMAALFAALSGCGSSDGPALVEAGGTVTYQGRPLPDAIVTFVPEKGPVATGKTDLEGRFTLSTGAREGVVPGKAGVSIMAVQDNAGEELEAKADHELMIELTKKMGQMAQGKVKAEPDSIIPKKYSSTTSSGLTATVTEDADKNQFTFDLQP